MSRIMRALGIAALLCLAGCATSYVPAPYWNLREESFQGFKPGVATRDEVLRTIGNPVTEMYFPRQQDDVIEYRYVLASATVMLAWLHFDPQGVLKYTEHRLDPAYHGNGVTQ